MKTASLLHPENQETVRASGADWGGGGELTNTQTPAPQAKKVAKRNRVCAPGGRRVKILRGLGQWWLWFREGQSRPEPGFAQHRREQLCGDGALGGDKDGSAWCVFLPSGLTVCTNHSFSSGQDQGPGRKRGQSGPGSTGQICSPTFPRAEAVRAGASRGLETALPE